MSYLDNLYSRNTSGGSYVPFNYLDIYNSNFVAEVRTVGNVLNEPPQNIPPAKTEDIRLFITNLSNFKNQFSVKLFNNLLFEGSTLVFSSNEINDVLTIKADPNPNFKLKNYFKLEKKLVEDTINLANNTFEVALVPGVVLYTLDANDNIISEQKLKLPTVFDIGFDLEEIPAVVVKEEKIRNIYVVSNYDNEKLTNELVVKLTSKDIKDSLQIKNQQSGSISNLDNLFGDVNLEVTGLSSFKLNNIRWEYADRFSENEPFDINKFKILSNDNKTILPKEVLDRDLILCIDVAPNDSKLPTLSLATSEVNVNVEETIILSKDLSKDIQINFNLENTDYVRVKTPYVEFNEGFSTTEEKTFSLNLDLKEHFQNNLGAFKVLLIPYSNLFGDGVTQSVVVKINQKADIPIIDSIDYPTEVSIPIHSFGDVKFEVKFESTLATSVLVYHTSETDNNLIKRLGPKDTFSSIFNSVKQFVTNNTLELLIVPFNNSIKGDIERITITFNDPGFYVSTQNLKDELFNAISSYLQVEFSKESFLTHIASFETDDKQILISNWDVDNTTFTKFKRDELGNQVPDGEIKKSAVLKLYEPLPPNINKNDSLWISELKALPILQSVVVSGIDEDICIPLRPANFNAEIDFVKSQSTGYESFDNLLLGDSETSQQIVDKYLAENFIDVSGVNIDYTDFSNFVKYSSAKERLINFRYKKELAEFYTAKIDDLLNSTAVSSTIVATDLNNLKTKKTNLITGFDGFENYLTQSVFTGSFVNSFGNAPDYEIQSYNTNSVQLFNSYISEAEEYDKNNTNQLKNNIPLHIVEDIENFEYLLFLDMVGNYFDILWAYIKGISEQRVLSEQMGVGISDELLYQFLKSYGWDAKNLNSNQQLWNYSFGLNGDGLENTFTADEYLGENTEKITPEKATKQIWRRIANNLPYLLKHKGSIRGITALLTCYGIPSSNLQIMEFGGPNNENVEDSPKYVYNSLTHNLVFDDTDSQLEIDFVGTPKPKGIEFKLKPSEYSAYTFISSSAFTFGVTPISPSNSVKDKYGKFTVNDVMYGDAYPFFDGNYHSILLNVSESNLRFYVKTNYKDRIVNSVESNTTINSVDYENTSKIFFTGFSGSLEEFRVWKTALSESVFDKHVVMPEAINGNHISSSTTDLIVRLDFERPQNLQLTSSINNVAPNASLVPNVTASNFSVSSTYPYNYDTYEREVALEIPNTGASRYYTNKVRLESQELIANLSPTKRATKKAFETSAKDSNRVGLFFSPNRDLDLDIAKSLGGQSFDDYIGNPEYEYGYTSYPELDQLRNYYFERVGSRNIYEFIRLIKYYDKSLFLNLRQMLPARAKVTTGLLIAPHILERNKIKVNKPLAENPSLETVITDTQITNLKSTYDVLDINLDFTEFIDNVDGENNTYESVIVTKEDYVFDAENVTFESNIVYNTDETVKAEYVTYEGTIDYQRNESTIQTELDVIGSGQVVGLGNRYIDIGFSTYFDYNGYGKYYYEENGAFKSKGIRGFVVRKPIKRISTGLVNGVSGSEFTYIDSSSFTTDFIIQEVGTSQTASLMIDGATIVTASGYLPTHHIYRQKHVGTENLFFKGSKQTSGTTIDGKSAVEEFVTNPTTLRVTAQGRSNNEPILEVD